MRSRQASRSGAGRDRRGETLGLHLTRPRLVPAALSCSGSAKIDEPGAASGCQPVACKLGCEHGFATGADGCEVCECKAPPGGCDPVACNLYCEHGFAVGPDGCETCSCKPPPCEGPSPAGCIQNGCPSDAVCDTTQGCAPSNCMCDVGSGSWACTNDCGGGLCVPAGAACRGPDPSGCVSKGCPSGEVCDTNLGCNPSVCSCDVTTGTWGCTADCSGGVCVPDPTGCSEPSPAGCIDTGCPLDQMCVANSGQCVPSSCTCDPGTGTWVCTDDCNGDLCAP